MRRLPNAQGSICPKGWKLPTSGTGSFNQNGSFAYLFRQYGLATGDNAGTVAAGDYNVALSPLYFVRSGRIFPSLGFLGFAGLSGFYWSSMGLNYTGSDDWGANAHAFNLDQSNIYSSGGPIFRWHGTPVRCLASDALVTLV